MTEAETVGWHHQLDGHEFEQALGVGDGQGSLVCCSPCGCKELDTTERPSASVVESSMCHLLMFTSDYQIVQNFINNILPPGERSPD